MGLFDFITGLGLSGSAGLNAYIPLLTVSLFARAGHLKLAKPFDFIASDEAILVLVVLLLIEFLADKVPGIDSVNDVIQTVVRPTAGAVAFATSAGIITELSPTLAFIIGLFPAAGMHAVKATTRPMVNMLTFGIGAPAMSLAEDVLSVIGAVLAILLPFVFLLFACVVAIVIWQVVRHARNARRARAMRAYAYSVNRYPPQYPPYYPPRSQ